MAAINYIADFYGVNRSDIQVFDCFYAFVVDDCVTCVRFDGLALQDVITYYEREDQYVFNDVAFIKYICADPSSSMMLKIRSRNMLHSQVVTLAVHHPVFTAILRQLWTIPPVDATSCYEPNFESIPEEDDDIILDCIEYNSDVVQLLPPKFSNKIVKSPISPEPLDTFYGDIEKYGCIMPYVKCDYTVKRKRSILRYCYIKLCCGYPCNINVFGFSRLMPLWPLPCSTLLDTNYIPKNVAQGIFSIPKFCKSSDKSTSKVVKKSLRKRILIAAAQPVIGACTEDIIANFKNDLAFRSPVDHLELIISLCFLIISLIGAPNWKMRLMILLAYITAHRVFSIIYKTCNIFSQFIDSMQGNMVESDDNNLTRPLSIMTAGLIAMYGSNGDTSKIPKIVKLGNAARAVTNLKNLDDSAEKIIVNALDLVYEVESGLPGNFRGKTLDELDIIIWLKEVNDNLLDIEFCSSALNDISKRELVEDLYKRGELLKSTLGSDSESKRELQYILKEKMMLVTKIFNYLRDTISVQDVRLEPYCIALVGPTGIGKSFMCKRLCMDIALKAYNKEELKDVTPANLFYTRNPISEYWDTYAHQKFVLWDEFAQIKTNVGDHLEVDCVELLKLINTAPYPLNMSASESKGKYNFMSDYVVLTSNILNFDTAKIASPLAVMRRRDIVIRPVIYDCFARPTFIPNQQLPINMLDPERWSIFCAAQNHNPNIPTYAFYEILDRNNPENVLQNLTYWELVNQIAMKSVEKRNKHRLLDSALDNYFTQGKNNMIQMDIPSGSGIQLNPTFKRSLSTSSLDSVVSSGSDTSMPSSGYGVIGEKPKVHIPESIRPFIFRNGKGKIQDSTLFDSDKIDVPPIKPLRNFISEKKKLINRNVDLSTMIIKQAKDQLDSKPLLPDITVSPYTEAVFNKILAISNTHFKGTTKFSLYMTERLKFATEHISGITQLIPVVLGLSTRLAPVTYETWTSSNSDQAKLYNNRTPHQWATFYVYVQTLSHKEHGIEASQALSQWLGKPCKYNQSEINYLIQRHKMPTWSRFDRVRNYISDLFVEFPLKNFIVGLGLVAVMVGLGMFVKNAFSKDTLKLPFVKESDHNTRMPSTNSVIQTNKPQSAINEQNQLQMDKLVSHLCVCKVFDGNIYVGQTKGIVIMKDALMIPTHLYDQIELCKGILHIDLPRYTYKCKFEDMDVHHIGDKYKYNDVSIIKFKVGSINSVDIVNLFMTEAQLSNRHDFPGVLIIRRSDIDVRYNYTKVVSQKQYMDQYNIPNNTVRVDMAGKSLYACQGWKYSVNTTGGDCGSPLCILNGDGLICGFHCASVRGDGFSPIITREWVRSVVGPHNNTLEMECLYKPGAPPKYMPRSVDYLGVATNVIHFPTSNTIVPSKLKVHLNWPNTRMPAMLRTSESVSPLEISMLKYPGVSVSLPVNDLIVLRNLFVAKYMSFIDDKRVILNRNEILNGMDGLSSINMNSSVGYPHIMKHVNKLDMILYNEKEQMFVATDESLWNDLDKFEYNIRNNLSVDMLWVDYFKQETLPLYKAKSGKTRIFSSGNIFYNLLVRKYFGSFIVSVHKHMNDSGICIGIDPHSADWQIIYEKMIKYGPRVLAGDYKNFDSSIPGNVLYAVCDIVNEFYHDEHSDFRVKLFDMLFDVPHQINNHVYLPSYVNPSGNPLTSELNSVSNVLLLWYAVAITANVSYGEVVRDVKLLVYGDDNVVAYPYMFDTKEFIQVFKTIGMTYTSVDKLKPLEWENMTDIRFLNRKFVPDRSTVLAPLPLEVLQNSVMWVSGDLNHDEIMKDTVRAAVYELKHLPYDVSLKFYMQLWDACSKTGVEFSYADRYMHVNNFKIEAITTPEYIKLWFTYLLYKLFAPNTTLDIDWHKFIGMKGRMLTFDAGPLIGQPKGIFVHRGIYVKYMDLALDISFGSDGVQVRQMVDGSIISDKNFVIKNLDWPGSSYKVWTNNCTHWMNVQTNTKCSKKLDKWYKQNTNISESDMESMQGLVDVDVDMPVSIVSVPLTSIGLSTHNRSVVDIGQSFELLQKKLWVIGAVSGTLISTIDLPQVIQEVEQYKLKFKYNTLIRANLCFSFTNVATRFHAGSLIAYFVPQTNKGYPGDVEFTEHAATGMLHTMIYAGSRETQLIVPFVYDRTAVNMILDTDINEWGTCYVRVFNPLISLQDQTNASLIVKFKFVDIQLSGPTSAYPHQTMMSVSSMFGPNVVQSDEKEAIVKSEKGIVTGLLENIAGIANFVGRVPIFRPLAGTIELVANFGSTISRAIGLSKPTSVAANVPIIPRPFACVSHYDGLDMSIKLSMSPTNSVTISPCLFGSCVDEMNYEYLLRTPVCIGTVEWNDTMSQSSNIVSLPVTPQVHSREKQNNKLIMQNSYLGHIAMMFQYWRGDIQFTFQIVCNEFHTGTLVAYFVPCGNKANNTKFTPFTQVSHVEFELGSTDSLDGIKAFGFTVPYFSETMYKEIVDPKDTHKFGDGAVTGCVCVDVVNMLCSPSVSSKVYVNIYVSAASNFQLAKPQTDLIQKYKYVCTRPLNVAQIEFDLRTRSQAQIGPDLPSLPLFTSGLNVNNIVMGESTESLRDVLKIATRRHEYSYSKPLAIRYVCYIPVTEFRKYTGTHGTSFDTFFDHSMRLFRYSRGSIRHKWAFNSEDCKISAFITLKKHAEIINEFHPVEDTFSFEGSPWAVCMTKLNPSLEYEIPYYHDRLSNVHGADHDQRCIGIEVEVFKTGKPFKAVLYEAIGDDFSSGFLLGPPQIQIRDVHDHMHAMMWKMFDDSIPVRHMDTKNTSALYFAAPSFQPYFWITNTKTIRGGLSFISFDFDDHHVGWKSGIYFPSQPDKSYTHPSVGSMEEHGTLPPFTIFFIIVYNPMYIRGTPSEQNYHSLRFDNKELGQGILYQLTYDGYKTSIDLIKMVNTQFKVCNYHRAADMLPSFIRRFKTIVNVQEPGIIISYPIPQEIN